MIRHSGIIASVIFVKEILLNCRKRIKSEKFVQLNQKCICCNHTEKKFEHLNQKCICCNDKEKPKSRLFVSRREARIDGLFHDWKAEYEKFLRSLSGKMVLAKINVGILSTN